MGITCLAVNDEILHHPDFILFQHRTNLPAPAAIGMVSKLWQWAMTFCKDGALPHDEYIIAAAAGWDGEPTIFCRALEEVGFLNSCFEIRVSLSRQEENTFYPFIRFNTHMNKDSHLQRGKEQ
jgi:hypothetical protein